MNYRVMKRPMFRIGGGVDSQGTGITSGMDTPKRGLVTGPGSYQGLTQAEWATEKAELKGLLGERREAYEGLGDYYTMASAMNLAPIFGSVTSNNPFEALTQIATHPDLMPSVVLPGLKGKAALKTKLLDIDIESKLATMKLDKPEIYRPSVYATKKVDVEDYHDEHLKLDRLEEELNKKYEGSETNPAYEEAREAINNRRILLRKLEEIAIPSGMTEDEARAKIISDYQDQYGAQATPSEEYIKKRLQKLYNFASGGRVGFQDSFPGTVGEGQNVMQGEGAAVQEQAMQPPAQNLQGITTEQRQAIQQDPYQILRGRLPPEIPDDIVRLIAYNKEAFQDFANIQTQDDVTAFNEKYGVQLVVDVGSV